MYIQLLCNLNTIINFMNSRDMLNQQKQEIARSVPDPSPRRGWGLGTRLDLWLFLNLSQCLN